MRVNNEQRRHTEQRIRAATNALLRAELPPNGKCDVSTLAQQAGISRATLYRTYPDLKKEFERRLTQQRTDGQIPDPRESQIAKLKKHNAELKQRIARQDAALAGLKQFKTRAISQLAAQHDEIDQLRAAANRSSTNVRDMHSRRPTTHQQPR
jgi:DeoR/GlpR family transcriptional regulator of sugar metabolism